MRPGRWLLACMILLGRAGALEAHDGPPFPIVMDRAVGPYTVSIWTDPDVGIGKFFVIVVPAAGQVVPDDLKVEVCVKPSSDRLPESCYSTARQKVNDKDQFYAEVELDREELWRVRVRLIGSNGEVELVTEVEATPPGYGKWDLLIYACPICLFSPLLLLWLIAALRRRKHEE